MTECVKKRVKRRVLCAGDLNIRVCIKKRSYVAPISTVDSSHDFELIATVWAALETKAGRNTFFVTNNGMESEVTHVFYMRWLPCLTAEKWIEHKSENYKILQVNNLEERDVWAECYCNVRGSTEYPVNDA